MAGGSTATPKNKTGSRWYKNSLRHAWGVGPPVRPAAARQPPKTSQQTADGSRRYKSSLRHAWGVGPPVRPVAARQPPKTSQQIAGGTTAVCITRGG